MNGELLKIVAVGLTAFVCATVLRVKLVDPQAKVRYSRLDLDEDFLASPGKTTLNVVCLEHQHAWADILWLGIVQHLGTKKGDGKKSDWDRLQRWADLATDLDPRYFVVYQSCSVHLSTFAGRTEASDQLLFKGRTELPRRWELPFYLGYNAYFLHADAEAASNFWFEAANLPGAPRFVASLAGRARFQSGDEEGAILILQMMLDSLPPGPRRRDVDARLRMLKSERILKAYDEACVAFREARGVQPKDGKELHQAQFVQIPPYDLLGQAITLDEGCRARTAFIKVREDEARERVGSERERFDNKKQKKPGTP